VAIVSKGLRINYRDTATRAAEEAGDVPNGCKARAYKDIADGLDAFEVMEELAECMTEKAAAIFQEKNEEIAFENRVRLAISQNMENHTCADPTHETTKTKEIREWNHTGITRNVHIHHDRPASQIHVIMNFISEEECDAIKDAASPKLHRGTVADGAGGHKLSEHRKAWQAGVSVPWEKEEKGDPIARVARRLYDYANHATGYNLTVEGQEDLMSIQYFGHGRESSESPDQYRPHCDGDCGGLPHKIGGRVATIVMYCDVPELGGSTNFQNSGVYVKPEVGAAAFFSYMDPVKHVMETGFTTHSGCPVIEGTKRIAVQWIRIGVDEENPWNSFNTLTMKKSEEEDC
jgi:hypothetical protein